VSVEGVLDALAQVEQRIQTEPMTARIKNLFRPRIVFYAPDGQVLGEIRSRLVFSGPHQASLNVMGTDLSIRVSGLFEKSYSLQTNGSTLLDVNHKPFASRYLARDWEGRSYPLGRRGSPWRLRFELMEAAAGEGLVRMDFAPLRCKADLFVSPAAGMKAGVAAGLAMLLYYNWYLGLRFMILSTSSRAG
jgi:hypothetical protein